jgi:hypothetical protein
MADGGGTIGGGSVYVKFHVRSDEGNPISEVELNDKAKTKTIRFVFPDGFEKKEVDGKLVVTVATEKLKKHPIKIAWEHEEKKPYARAHFAGKI